MGLLTATQSLTRYRVEGRLSPPLGDAVLNGLRAHQISPIDDQTRVENAGWTPVEAPYSPDFDHYPHVFGTAFVFSLRIDRKTVPRKLIEKELALETAKKLKDTGQSRLRPSEKKMLKDHVINMLYLRIPAIPSVFDVIWQYEAADLWFLSTLKKANETLISLFLKTFKLTLIPRLPYTEAYFCSELSAELKDRILNLSPPNRT